MTTTQRQVAWVTGASRGMGADTARNLAAAGYDVALTARDGARLDDVAAACRATGVDALALRSDLTDRTSVSSFADAALARFGRCDVVVNIGIHKGPSMDLRFLDTPLDELAVHYEADVIAPALLCQRAIPTMIANGGAITSAS